MAIVRLSDQHCVYCHIFSQKESYLYNRTAPLEPAASHAAIARMYCFHVRQNRYCSIGGNLSLLIGRLLTFSKLESRSCKSLMIASFVSIMFISA